MNARVVLAFTGDAAGAAAIRGLVAAGTEVVALSLDTGYGSHMHGVREQALGAGAARCHVLDVHEEFARVALLPALHASALDADLEVTAADLTRPLLAAKLVEVARLEQAGEVAYVSASDALKGVVSAIAPDLRVRVLEPHEADAGPPRACAVRRSRAARPDRPAAVALRFDGGVPSSVNGVALTLAELFDLLKSLADDHGVRACVPQLAYDALVEAGSDSGVVHVGLESGRCAVTAVEPHVPASLVGAF